MFYRTNIFKVSICLLLFVIFTKNSFGVYIIKKENYRELPPYCRYTGKLGWNQNTKGYEKYREKFGKDWLHMHHYCMGLDKINYAFKHLAEDKAKWEFKLRSAIDEFDYIIKNADPRFKLLPMILVKKGQVLTILKDYSGGFISLQKAITLRKDYAPAYIAICDIYLAFDNVDMAIKILRVGLKHAPNSEEIIKTIKKLEYKKK